MTPQAEHALAMREQAEIFRKFGFNLIPLGADKRPVVTGVSNNGRVLRFGWEDYQTQPQTPPIWKGVRAQAYWAEAYGIAAVCGHVSGDLVCIDFDTPKDTAAFTFPPELLNQFLAGLGVDASSWIVNTPRGGYHVWVRCPGLQLEKGKLDNPALKQPAGFHIELRWHGHYAALPGSQHPNGTYAWRNTAPTTPPCIVTPDVLLAAYASVITPEPPKIQAPPKTQSATTNSNGQAHGAEKWAQTALANELAILQGTTNNRNDALNKAAFALGSIVAGGYLTVTEVTTALTDAALAIGLGEGEIAATIESGLQSGAKSPRYPTERPQVETEQYEYGFVVETPDPFEFDDVDLSDTPHVSWPYSSRKGQMLYLRENKDGDVSSFPIADFVVTIGEEIVDESGGVTLILHGEGVRRGKFTVEIPALEFGMDGKLLAALTAATGGIDPVFKDMQGHLRPAIGALTETATRQRRTRYYRTGWQDDTFTNFILPGQDDTTLITMPPQMAYSAPPAHARLDAGLAALQSLIEAFDPSITTPVIAALLLPPLLRPAGWGNERVALFIAGRTGSLKTSWTQTAMCLYGHGFSANDKLLKFGDGATRTAIMSFAAHAHDLPLFIDNYKPNTGNGKGDFVNLIHNILEGGDRKRADRAGNLRDNRLIRCIPIATGEDVPRDDAASLARILLVAFAWQRGEANDKLSAAQLNSHHLNAVGMAWLQWLADAGRADIARLAAQFPAYRAKWATTLRKINADSANIARVASNLAINELTWETANCHPTLGPALQAYTGSYRRGLHTIARTMSQSTTEAMEALQWRNALNELLASGQYQLVDRQAENLTNFDKDRRLGWKDSDGVYLLPSITLTAIKKLLGPNSMLISPTALYDQMQELGWIARRGQMHTTRTISVGSDRPHVLHLKPDALTIKAQDDDDSDPTEASWEELGL